MTERYTEQVYFLGEHWNLTVCPSRRNRSSVKAMQEFYFSPVGGREGGIPCWLSAEKRLRASPAGIAEEGVHGRIVLLITGTDLSIRRDQIDATDEAGADSAREGRCPCRFHGSLSFMMYVWEAGQSLRSLSYPLRTARGSTRGVIKSKAELHVSLSTVYTCN